MADVSIVRTVRPVTLKRSRPNPLFQEWLEELREEAKQKKCKLEHQLTEALTSLSKYPLTLNTAAECRILKGFDSRLCDYIEQRLITYNKRLVANVDQNKTNDIIEPDSVFNKSRCKNHIKNFLLYSTILVTLKKLWIDGNDNISIHTLLLHASNEIRETKKLVTSKKLTKLPQNLKPLRDLVGIDPVAENCFLTDIGFSEACYIEYVLKGCNNNINTSTQTDNIPFTISVNCELTSEDAPNFEVEPGNFDIILLIDKNETSGLSKKNDPTVTQFKKYLDLKHEYRSLKVGDFAWIARHKVYADQELVLPYIVERKRLDDFSASIKDGRFHEQKFRLRRCGLNNVIYLVENYATKKYTGLPVHTLMQALANTRVQDGFKVHITDSLVNSVRFLAMMTKRLNFEYAGKKLKGHHAEADRNTLMTFEFFNKMSVKNKPLTVTETFIKLLLQLKGLSVEKALAITSVYKTPKSLIQAYEYLDREEGELLLANLKYGDFNRNVGPTISKSLYQLFSSFVLS